MKKKRFFSSAWVYEERNIYPVLFFFKRLLPLTDDNGISRIGDRMQEIERTYDEVHPTLRLCDFIYKKTDHEISFGSFIMWDRKRPSEVTGSNLDLSMSPTSAN